MGGNASSNSGGEGPRNEYKKPKKKISIVTPGMAILKAAGEKLEDFSRPYNTKRRKEFISKYNTNVPPSERINLTDEQIGSAEGLASLREVGYKTNQDMINQNNDNGGGDNNQKSIEQPKVASQMDNTGVKSNMITADKIAPTNVEMTEDERLISTKRKGRKTTMLTDIEEEQPAKLSKKVLLGA
jgi:hypothetical protein